MDVDPYPYPYPFCISKMYGEGRREIVDFPLRLMFANECSNRWNMLKAVGMISLL